MNRKPYGYYKKKSSIIKDRKDKAKAKILLWDYFFVNRETGVTFDNCCRVMFLSGKNKGSMHDFHCSQIGEGADALWAWE